MSVTELYYDAQTKRLEGSIRIFTNDLEDALSRLEGRKVDLYDQKQSAKLQTLLEEYLVKRFQLKSSSGGLIPYNLLGFENQEEATWIYFQTGATKPMAKITVYNSILCDFLPEQMNIVRFIQRNREESLRVICPENTLGFDIQGSY